MSNSIGSDPGEVLPKSEVASEPILSDDKKSESRPESGEPRENDRSDSTSEGWGELWLGRGWRKSSQLNSWSSLRVVMSERTGVELMGFMERLRGGMDSVSTGTDCTLERGWTVRRGWTVERGCVERIG